MSVKAKAIKTLYRAKRITLDGVKKAVADGIITEAEYETIITEKEVATEPNEDAIKAQAYDIITGVSE